MPTKHQISQLDKKLKTYKKKYLRKRYADLDESATRLMINSLLTEVLGYTELEDIKTEYRIRGEYADYVIQLARKKHFVVEVKAVQLDLSEKHLRQSIAYAANEGIDWIILTNGRQIQVYKVIFSKPIDVKLLFDIDLTDRTDFKHAAEQIIYLSKKSVIKSEIDGYWHRFEALEPNNLYKNLYASEVVKFLRKVLKQKTGLYFAEEDILESVHQIILRKIESQKPKQPLSVIKKK